MAEILQKVSRFEKSICDKCSHRFVCLAIDNQPCFECNQFTEEVVHCKDCKHTRKKNKHEQFMYNENVCICTKEDIWGITKNEPVWDDFFCAYGERKDESE